MAASDEAMVKSNEKNGGWTNVDSLFLKTRFPGKDGAV